MAGRELSLPYERKTIKPLNLGGVIGGTKFITHGILFKLANDHSRIFGGNNFIAAKVAGHELKALTALFNANEILQAGISLPLMALVDFMGFRLIACVIAVAVVVGVLRRSEGSHGRLALCPLDGERTLIHGTMDAGQNIKSDQSASEERKLLRVANHLNLKPHNIAGHLIPLAVDCELHRCARIRNPTYCRSHSRANPRAEAPTGACI